MGKRKWFIRRIFILLTWKSYSSRSSYSSLEELLEQLLKQLLKPGAVTQAVTQAWSSYSSSKERLE